MHPYYSKKMNFENIFQVRLFGCIAIHIDNRCFGN